MSEKELTPTQKKQIREDNAAHALGYETMRRLATALAKAYASGTMQALIAKISINYYNYTEEK